MSFVNKYITPYVGTAVVVVIMIAVYNYVKNNNTFGVGSKLP